MVSRQLELALGNQRGLRPVVRRGNRSGRANWWFEKMRGVVNKARDWEASPLPEEETSPLPPQTVSVPSTLDVPPRPVPELTSQPVLMAPRRRFRGPLHKVWE